ncbi:Vacuolar protein sorting-associated protein, partial [Globisporangium splendens]
MFEKLVESILVEYVSEWVEDLDSEKMKVALFGGKVEFRELKLKASSLDKFQLPLKVKAGTIGTLTMKVSWKRLAEETVEVQVDDLFLLVVPCHEEELHRQKQQSIKKQQHGSAAMEEDEEDSYALRLRWTKQQEVRELLEKNKTEENTHATEKDSENSGGDTTASFRKFTSEMTLAGFYCDDASSVQDLVFVGRQAPSAASYIVHPFNTNIKMTVNHDDTTAFPIPQFQFVVDISSIDASVTPDQCNDLISVANFVSTHEMYLKRIHCRKKRPSVPVKRNAKKWWQYAFFGVQVVYSLPSRRLSGLSPGASSTSLTSYTSNKPSCDWRLFGMLWKCQKEYVRLHKVLLRAAAKKLPVGSVVAERCRLNELEDLLDVDSIVFFRMCATQELELEESWHDSAKKLSNWKARWAVRSHSAESDVPTGQRSLDPLERFLLYSTIGEQMHASSTALAAKERERQNSQTLLFAIDIAISSIRLSLIEHYVYDSATTTGSTREFLHIKSIHMLDFSQIESAAGERLSQPLFCSLASPQSGKELEQHFMKLSVDSSETKFKLDCSFEPFRYIHNLSVATKLQTYFVVQVDVSPALRESAEDALAYSSEWLNNAVFAGPSASSVSGSSKSGKPSSLSSPSRVVELSIRLPEVDILVLTSDTSPILQARLLDLNFQSGNLLDTFVFSIEGVNILFYDGLLEGYRQVLQVSASWTKSNEVEDSAFETEASSAVSKKVAEGMPKTLHRSTSSFTVKEFDSEDETFGLSVMIPQILIVLEGEDANDEQSGTGSEPTTESTTLAIDLVLDIKKVNIEAKFSATAQAVAVDILSLVVFKRLKEATPSPSGKKEKIRTADAILKVNEEVSKFGSPYLDHEHMKEPEPVYDPVSGTPTCKLLEVGPRVSFVLCSADPFKGKIEAKQVVLYWDQDLLVALFRSYLMGNVAFGGRSASSSRASSRSSSKESASNTECEADSLLADVLAPEIDVDPPAPFGLELHVERWYIFLRPPCARSPNFALKFYGRDVLGDITTLKTLYLVAKFQAKGGIILESSRSVYESNEATGSEQTTSSESSEDVCELLCVNDPVTICVESAGYGSLSHRTGAGAYANIQGSGIDLNCVHGHYAVFGDYLLNQIISFFDWISVQTQPPGDEAVVQADKKSVQLKLEQQIAASKTKMFSHKAVFIDVVALPVPIDANKKKKKESKEQKKKGFKDMEDVAREMEKLCSHVTVSLYQPGDWDNECEDDKSSAQASEKRKVATIEANQTIELALDLHQLELFGCILTENFGHNELLPRAKSGTTLEDEFLATDVQVLVGDVSLSVVRSNSIVDYEEKKALNPEERAQVDLSNVKVVVLGYSSERAQYRVLSSKALLWKVDVETVRAKNKDESSSTVAPVAKKVLTSCAELYQSTEESGSPGECIDVTIDEHEPPSDPNITESPMDIRVHVDTCAFTPAIIQFASRVAPFLFCKPRFRHYIPEPDGPMNVSVTTGAVHCMIAKYYPGSSDGSNHGEPQSTPREDELALHLILSGCAVVRYTKSINTNDNLEHAQLFGRKMSLEIVSQWPPISDCSSSTDAPSSPLPPPTHSTISPRLRCVSTPASLSCPNLVSLVDCRRVLCDDFGIDMDLVDTMKNDGMMKISASRSHFHAVLCAFDIFMISQVSINADDSDAQVPKSIVESDEQVVSTVLPDDIPTAVSRKTEIIVNMIVEDASVTFVREIGEYFTPVARIYTFCAMCEIRVEIPTKAPLGSETALGDMSSSVVEIVLHFSEESGSELRDDEGMSIWGFNSVLGSWEPVMEPWTFALGIQLVDDHTGKVTTSIDLRGSDVHSLSLNFSPSLLDSFCAIAKEMEQLFSDPPKIRVSTASIISCGFYLANDCGEEISYWVSDNGAAAHASRGYSYAPRQKRIPEILLPRHKVPLKLSTAIFHSLPADQTISFSWGDDDWHPLTDVRTHSAGKCIYSVLPRSKTTSATPPLQSSSDKSSSASSTFSSISTAKPPVLLALFDVPSVFGYRTLTVSSLVRVFNDADIAVDCRILAEDGKSIVEIGTIEAHDACGIPITLVRVISSVRVVVKPHKPAVIADAANATAPNTSIGAKDHRWSNELFISDREECAEHFASCSRILDDYDCKCQRTFDGSQPLHVSQVCKANGSFFRVWSRVFTASNTSNLRYSQMRVLPPLTFENKCGVAFFVVVFVFKKVRRAGAQDREYFHLVASEKIPPHGAQAGVSSAGSAARAQEEMEYFYCSESNVLNIQIEGNAVQGSSAQQFRLGATMEGANSSLRLFDEGKKQCQDNKPKPTSAADSAVVVKPSATTSFSWCMRPTIPFDACIRLKIQGGGSGGDGNVTGWRWSGKISLHEVSETALKLSNKYTNQVHVLRVEIRVEASVRAYIVLTSEDTALFPLYQITNSSASEMMHFKQYFDGGHGEFICFGWDEAYFMQSLERVLSVTYSADAAHTKILLDQPGTAQRVEIPATKTKAASEIFLHWYLNGVTKTIHVHDTELPRDKLTGKQNAPPPLDRVESSSGVLQRASTLVSELNLNLKLPNVVLSVLSSKPEEVLLFSAQDLECAYAKTMGEHDQCEIKIGSFQLDNQLDNAVFPVIFTPIPSNKSAISFIESTQKAARPMTPPTIQERKKSNADTTSGENDEEEERFLHMSIFRLSYGDDVEYIKYFSALLQPARLQIDDFLVISLGSVFSGTTPLNSTADVTIEKIPPVERRMYIETLHFRPIKVQLTFQQNNLTEATFFDDQAAMLLPVVYVILKSNLVNIDCASLNLNALHIYHSFTTRAFMLSTIQQHYAFQGVLQIYALVGAADILGNPIGLVTNLGTGAKEFFYEPVAGMVQSPQEFVLGLARGTASLVKNSVYGTFNAASKFTGALSSGIAALSMNRQGILAGVSGVITAPAMGAYNNGLTDFVEGVGKGLIGVAVKPAAGILDLAARTTAGTTATATVFDKKARNTRMRLPRIMHTSDKRLLWGAQKTAKGVHAMIRTATNVQVSSSMNTLVTKSSMSTVLIPLRDTETAFADRVAKCVANLVAQQRERTPVSETYSAPPPRNSIGLVLEPIRDQEQVQGYEGHGGRVVDVFLGSACFRAGVEVGDIIVGFGGKKLEPGDHGSALRYQLSLMKKGDTSELMVLRHSEIKTIRVATE